MSRYAAPEEVMEMPGHCGACGAPTTTRMYRTEIPFFKEVILMSDACDSCGYRNSEVKGGGGVPAKGRRIELRVEAHEDLRRDVLAEAQRHDWGFLDAVVAGVFTVPGDGCVDFPAVLGALPGYDGWLVVEAEQDPAKANPLRYATMGFRNLSDYARAAGLR